MILGDAPFNQLKAGTRDETLVSTSGNGEEALLTNTCCLKPTYFAATEESSQNSLHYTNTSSSEQNIWGTKAIVKRFQINISMFYFLNG